MAASAAPQHQSSSLFFDSARACKEWVKTLPQTNVAQAQQKIVDALRNLNSSGDIVPLERLTCMELLRAKVAQLLATQRARFAGKTIPLPHGDAAAWKISGSVVAEMEAGYRRCWVDAEAAEAPLSAHAALIIQRTLRYLGLQMLVAGFVHRAFDGVLWRRLHQQWLEAEARHLTTKRVKDSIGAIDGYSTIERAYTDVLLWQAANVYALSSRQIDFVDAVLRRFGHKVSVDSEFLANPAEPVLSVDVLMPCGASFEPVKDATGSMRALDVAALAKSLKRRIKKLAAGEDPVMLDLPAEWSIAEASQLLTRLYQLWCEGAPEGARSTRPRAKEAILAFGIADTHFFVSGNPFVQPGVSNQLTRKELADIELFGKVSEATIRARYAEFNYGTETWSLVAGYADLLRLQRPSSSAQALAIGKLVSVKLGKDDAFHLFVISELMEDLADNIEVTLAKLPGKPEAIAVRAAESRGRMPNYVQGFRLPPVESIGSPETLVVPAKLVQQGRGIDIFHQAHGTPKEVIALEFIERGVDFDRLTIR